MANQSVSRKSKYEHQRLAISVEETAWRLSVSPSFVRLEISHGRLRSLRLGRRVLVSEVEIQRYLAANRSPENSQP